MTFETGVTLKLLRIKAGMTQAYVAEKAGINIVTLHYLENGKHNGNIRTINQILAVYGYELKAVKKCSQ